MDEEDTPTPASGDDLSRSIASQLSQAYSLAVNESLWSITHAVEEMAICFATVSYLEDPGHRVPSLEEVTVIRNILHKSVIEALVSSLIEVGGAFGTAIAAKIELAYRTHQFNQPSSHLRTLHRAFLMDATAGQN